MKTIFVSLTIFFAVILFGFESVSACSCSGMEKPTAEFRKTPIVFVGTVKSVKLADSRQFGDEYNFNNLRTKFVVDEALKGVNGTELDIYSSNQGTACGIRFQPGEQYLVYAYVEDKEKKYYSTNSCSRTRMARYVEDEIEVLISIAKGAFEPRIYGRVEEVVRGIYLLDFQDNVPMSNIKVFANNGVTVYQTTTDLGGNFRFINIKTGIYKISIEPPLTHRVNRDSWNFREKTGTDYSYQVSTSDSPDLITIETRIDGQIKGRVVDENGKLVGKNIAVSLVSKTTADKEVGDIHYIPTSTDESGNFEFYGIPPGEYYLGFNLETKPNKGFPYPRTYFPGTPEIQKAKIIALGKAEKLDGFVLTLPAKVEEIEVRGKVVDADGKPVKGAIVERYGLYYGEWRDGDSYWLKNIKQPTFEGRIETDANGEFVLKLLKGNKYRLNAFLNQLKSENFEIEVKEAVPSVALVLNKKTN